MRTGSDESVCESGGCVRSAGGCFGASEGVDIGGASSAVSQLHWHQMSEEPICS